MILFKNIFKNRVKFEVGFRDSAIKDIQSMADFYKAINLDFEDMEIWGKKVNVKVQNIFWNKKTGEKVRQLILANSKKHPKLKALKQSYRESAVNFDWINYSPVDKDDVPENTVVVRY